MKKNLLILLSISFFLACKKERGSDINHDTYLTSVCKNLHDSLQNDQYATLNLSAIEQVPISSSEINLLLVPIINQDKSTNFLLLKTDKMGNIVRGKFINITAASAESPIPPADSTATAFDGLICYRNLNNLSRITLPIIQGHIVAIKNKNDMVSQRVEVMQGTLPDVVVTTYSSSAGINWGYWYNLFAMINDLSDPYSGNSYTLMGGGDGSNTSSTVQIDFEFPEQLASINLQKYLDCFSSIPDVGATFTVTIASDIPVDGQPSKFFNWSQSSPGHTYIELYKLGSNGALMAQNFGFYPDSPWKTTTGGNIGSKMIDDAGHEYNARYTISVNAVQFQAAIEAAKTCSNYYYNIASYNCTDFALSVFNSAGGNLSINQYSIPGFPNGPNGSNTPQGLYNKISDLTVAGNTSAQTNANKAYGGTSHGPCN